MLNIYNHCANTTTNKPKGYGSINKGLEVKAYYNRRLDYWAKQVGNGLYTEAVQERAEKDKIEKYGKPF
jgi:hypothetical protein